MALNLHVEEQTFPVECYMRVMWSLLTETLNRWMEHKAQRLGAALAYYTVFSIAPLLVIVVAIVNFLYPGDSLAHIHNQISSFLGNGAADSIAATIRSMDRTKDALGTLIGIVTLVIGSTAAFGQLQDAMNTIWEVAPKSGRVITETIRTRLVSFLMVLGMCGILILSIAATTMLNIAIFYLAPIAPRAEFIWKIADFGISMAIATVWCALVYKMLPDVKIAWNDVWIGAAVTALLFNLGKLLTTAYLVRSTFATAYGAAGSLMVMLAWVYYSAQIVLLGAEFTYVYAKQSRSRIRPVRGAVFLSDAARIHQGIPKARMATTAMKRSE
jgi:membrane protein